MTTRTCKQLIEEYPRRSLQFPHTRLPIVLPDGDTRDVYNISSPFSYHGALILLGRVEYRHNEDSDVVFFCRESGKWVPDKRFQVLKHLQDPFYTFIHGHLILGGVQIFETAWKGTSYRTVFFKETKPFSFQQFACGPDGMKDIRLLELSDGCVLVTTRAQGKVGGRGEIGWLILHSVDELNPQVFSSANLFEDQFTSDEWGGTNQLHMLKNGKVGVLSHIANFDDAGNRHYYCTCFWLDPKEGKHSPMKMIAVRNNFEAGESKRPDLQDVIFSGGLVRMGDGTARLYCGVGDAEAHCISIPDPFSEWENTSYVS
jgi:hypothetical protein